MVEVVVGILVIIIVAEGLISPLANRNLPRTLELPLLLVVRSVGVSFELS